MAKYIVDLDAFYECLDFLASGKVNGNDWTYVNDVKALIQRFPKDKVEETLEIRVKRDVNINREV